MSLLRALWPSRYLPIDLGTRKPALVACAPPATSLRRLPLRHALHLNKASPAAACLLALFASSPRPCYERLLLTETVPCPRGTLHRPPPPLGPLCTLGQAAKMSAMRPRASPDNLCTVIHDNTLYTFSPDGFSSRPLEGNSQSRELAMGVKVTGAACLGSTPPDATQASFFVVGGKDDSDEYSGLQKYTYSTGQWTTIQLVDRVTKGRQGHAAMYLEANDAILMYGGSQDGHHGPSTQTFTVEASGNHAVQAYESVAPPATAPVLGSWSSADAAMTGGGTSSRHAKVWLFNPAAGWRDSGASLAAPLDQDTSVVQALVVGGDDGSKCLLVFDLGQSPNKVSRVVLQDTSGAPVYNSSAVAGSGAGARRRAGGLSLDRWPDYNATLAPTETRNKFAMATGSDGMVVFSGGNGESPMAIFDVKTNSWVNATQLLGSKEAKALTSSTTTTASSTSTADFAPTSTSATTTASATPAATTSSGASLAGNADSGPSTDAILGITLGTITGILVLLGLILLLLRRHKKRGNHTEADQARGTNGPTLGEKDAAAHARSGLLPKAQGHFRGHYPQASQESYSSMAILMGRMNKDRSGLSRKKSSDTFHSSASSLHKQFKSTISKPMPQMAEHPDLMEYDEVGGGPSYAAATASRPRNRPTDMSDGTRRSSGWNKYWSGGSALQILGFGAAKRSTMASERSSHYSERTSHHNTNNARVTQDSATVPPLHFETRRPDDGRPSVNSVNSGSPVVAEYSSKLPTEGMSGTIERPVSSVSSGYSSGIPESINDVWGATDDRPWGVCRAPSSAYAAASQYGASLLPSAPGAGKPPSGVSNQPQLAMAATSSDMSWLNLGDQNRPRV